MFKSEPTLRADGRPASLVRLYRIVLMSALPVTAILLRLVSDLAMYSPHPDVTGLAAVSIGITGCLLFYMFLYRYQVFCATSPRKRRSLFVQHIAVTILLFALVVWLGFASPWKNDLLWGSYDLETCARSWIIAVLVVGSLSFLGSVFDYLRSIERFAKGGDAPGGKG